MRKLVVILFVLFLVACSGSSNPTVVIDKTETLLIPEPTKESIETPPTDRYTPTSIPNMVYAETKIDVLAPSATPLPTVLPTTNAAILFLLDRSPSVVSRCVQHKEIRYDVTEFLIALFKSYYRESPFQDVYVGVSVFPSGSGIRPVVQDLIPLQQIDHLDVSETDEWKDDNSKNGLEYVTALKEAKDKLLSIEDVEQRIIILIGDGSLDGSENERWELEKIFKDILAEDIDVRLLLLECPQDTTHESDQRLWDALHGREQLLVLRGNTAEFFIQSLIDTDSVIASLLPFTYNDFVNHYVTDLGEESRIFASLANGVQPDPIYSERGWGWINENDVSWRTACDTQYIDVKVVSLANQPFTLADSNKTNNVRFLEEMNANLYKSEGMFETAPPQNTIGDHYWKLGGSGFGLYWWQTYAPTFSLDVITPFREIQNNDFSEFEIRAEIFGDPNMAADDFRRLKENFKKCYELRLSVFDEDGYQLYPNTEEEGTNSIDSGLFAPIDITLLSGPQILTIYVQLVKFSGADNEVAIIEATQEITVAFSPTIVNESLKAFDQTNGDHIVSVPIKYLNSKFHGGVEIVPELYAGTRKTEDERQNAGIECQNHTNQFDWEEIAYFLAPVPPEFIVIDTQNEIIQFQISLPDNKWWNEKCGYQLIYIQWPEKQGFDDILCDFYKTKPSCQVISDENDK